MDKSLALRLDQKSSHYNSELYHRLAKLACDYVQNGLQTLNYFLPDFDAANDLANALAGLPAGTNSATFDKLDRTATRNYSHPCGATQIDVLATAISQILFGGETNRRVEPRHGNDTVKADAVNELLAWNDQQNDSYIDGFLYIKDCIIFNRGIQYDYWQDTYENEKVAVEYEIPPEQEIDPITKKPIPTDEEPEKVTRWKTVKKKVGGFTKITNISPYDFICDPTIPISRFQECRYAGHRVILSWSELKRRSELPIDDYQYVIPAVVEKIKNQRARKGITAITPNGSLMSTSRSFFERQRRGNPTPDTALTDKINTEDGGTVECFSIIIRCRPSVYEIYKEEEEELIEFLLSGEMDLLSVNVMTNMHGEFPYTVGEARPNAHMQFSPSIALLLKPTQDQVDDLKWRHAEQIARSGMMFLADATKCDIESVLQDTSRIRQAILRTEEGQGVSPEQIIYQIPITDTTANFPSEMQMWKGVMEETSGANPNLQGQTEDPSQTLGQFQDVAQMAMGRVSTIARNLSVRSLVRQTRRIVMNFQQWMPDVVALRIIGNNQRYEPTQQNPKFMNIRRDPMGEEESLAEQHRHDMENQRRISVGEIPQAQPPRIGDPDIQLMFDVSPHDGSLAGTDSRAVAAASRLIEASGNPAFQAAFDNTVAGNMDAKALLFWTARKSGLPAENFIISKETAKRNAKARMLAEGGGMPQQGMPPQGGPEGIPQAPEQGGMPNAAQVPPTPSAEPATPIGVTL